MPTHVGLPCLTVCSLQLLHRIHEMMSKKRTTEERKLGAEFFVGLLSDLQDNLDVFFPDETPMGPFDQALSAPPTPAGASKVCVFYIDFMPLFHRLNLC